MDDISTANKNSEKLLEIFENIQLMKKKETQLQIAIETEKISRSHVADQDLDKTLFRIKEISEEVLEEASVKNAVELALKRIQMSDVIHRLLADDEILTNGDIVSLQYHKISVEDMLKRQTELSSKILQRTQELEEMKLRVTKLRKDSLISTAKRKRLLEKVQEARQQKDEPSPWNSEIHQIANNLHDTERTLKLIMPILQCLIVGSGVNWAQDKCLKELVLSLGRSLDVLLQAKDSDVES